MRVGMGYDIHRLEAGFPCMVGGVHLPYEKGTVGYSDGDPLLHAICDALLGAAGRGDLGCYFPEGDPKWKGIASLTLLNEVAQMLFRHPYHIVNLDAVVLAERPKIASFVHAMKANISRCLACSPNQVNIKATTNERLGFIGREEGIAAYAVCMIEDDHPHS